MYAYHICDVILRRACLRAVHAFGRCIPSGVFPWKNSHSSGQTHHDRLSNEYNSRVSYGTQDDSWWTPSGSGYVTVPTFFLSGIHQPADHYGDKKGHYIYIISCISSSESESPSSSSRGFLASRIWMSDNYHPSQGNNPPADCLVARTYIRMHAPPKLV